MIKLDFIEDNICIGEYGKYEYNHITVETFNNDYIRIKYYNNKILSRHYSNFLNSDNNNFNTANEVKSYIENYNIILYNDFSFNNIEQNETLIIKEKQEMISSSLIINGVLIIDGILTILK